MGRTLEREGWSSSDEDEDERFVRLRTPVEPLGFGEYPTPAKYRSFINNVVTVCCTASNRPKRRTLRRLCKIREAKSELDVMRISRPWEAFDSALLQGVMQCAATSL